MLSFALALLAHSNTHTTACSRIASVSSQESGGPALRILNLPAVGARDFRCGC